MLKNKHKRFRWSTRLAYAVGLITSDGNLSRDQRHISFVSKNVELVQTFQKALGLHHKIQRRARGGERAKKYFYVDFSNKMLYAFLTAIGLTPAKSKTIRSVLVPEKFFADFLRGLFDGDGTFYSYYDTRWPNSFAFRLSLASASLHFIHWLKNKLTQLYKVKGFIHQGAGVYNLEYTKGDSRILITKMYHRGRLLFFAQKQYKISQALIKDKKFGLIKLQKQRRASSAVERCPEEAGVPSSTLGPGIIFFAAMVKW